MVSSLEFESDRGLSQHLLGKLQVKTKTLRQDCRILTRGLNQVHREYKSRTYYKNLKGL